MTAKKMVQSALNLLGYDGTNGNLQLNARIMNKALGIINRIYSDLWRICGEGDFEPIRNLGEEIKLPERAVNDVFIYGVAMFFAQSESDGDQQLLYRSLYNQKRASLTQKSEITDVIPRSDDL